MAFLEEKELWDLYTTSKSEADVWKKPYNEYERLAANDLADDLDENLPETNDGSLAASLFKLPKRIVSSKLQGRAKALDRDEAWVTELANITWTEKIIPNANSQAPFHRKWKDSVRKSAIYGSVPLITLFVDKDDGGYVGSDFIVAQPQDVVLEAGKISDYDSDVIFWDVYYSKLQLKNILETAKAENKEAKEAKRDSYNKWDTKVLEELIKGDFKQEREGQDIPKTQQGKAVEKGGIHLCIAYQRGIDAPFYMYSKDLKKTVREWTNPDPTGDLPIHYLYCYQDFINPYGIGICKLAGGTQNVLDYMRQADVLATQIGIRPPIEVSGDTTSTDFDSLVYAQDAIWESGTAKVERQEIANGVYSELPNRISMYKTSLNQMIPTGDTSIGSDAGDPQYSKTPAGVKFQQSSLSIDDQDFKDNLDMTYEAVAKSMINTMFANMSGSDLLKLSDEDRDKLIKAGLEFPLDDEKNPSNELEIIWDNARATFNFEMDATQDIETEAAKRLEGLTKVAELLSADPNAEMLIAQSGKKVDRGELYAEMIKLSSDNDKIITDIDPEDQEQMAEEQLMQQEAEQGAVPEQPEEQPVEGVDPTQPNEEHTANMDAVMNEYGVDQETAAIMLMAEEAGVPVENIPALLDEYLGGQE